jgi:ribosome-binding factor A
MADVKRAVRVAARVQEELALLLSRTVKDPRTKGVVISRVTMTDDLRLARIYFRLLEGAGEAEQASAKTGLAKATPLLRRELTRAAGLRVAPELSFFHDDGAEDVLRVERLLHEIATDAKKKSAKKTRE